MSNKPWNSFPGGMRQPTETGNSLISFSSEEWCGEEKGGHSVGVPFNDWEKLSNVFHRSGIPCPTIARQRRACPSVAKRRRATASLSSILPYDPSPACQIRQLTGRAGN